MTVVVAAQGYPAAPRSGDVIEGLEKAETADGTVYVLHAGTREQDGLVLSAGGRVLSVTATGADLAQARERAYAGVAEIRLEGSQHRTDIALRAAQEAAAS